jgi:YD repeat-containing protein
MRLLRRRVAAGFVLALGLSAAATRVWADVGWVYDELGRLVGVVDASGATATYQYDAAGNLTAIGVSQSTVTVVELAPLCGAAGTSVTIFGTGFGSTPASDTVKFNGITAAVTSASATKLFVTVPAGNTAGPVSVTTVGGTATSSISFRGLCTAPVVTSFTPTIGVEGATVIISGANFSATAADDLVTFGVSTAVATSATATSLTVTVPEGAQSGPLTVATPFGLGTSTQDFIVVPSPHVAGDVDAAARTSVGQAKTVTVATPGHIAIVLFDGHEGERVSVLGSPTSPWRLTLVTPYGPQSTVNPPCGATLAFIRPITLPVTGTYAIVVDDPNGTATGSAAITVNDVTDITLPLIIGQLFAVGLSTPGQGVRFVFSGTAGQRVSAVITPGTLPCCYNLVAIYQPDGGFLHDFVRVDGGGFLDTRTLPVTGMYTMVLDPADNVGSVTFQLHLVPPDPTATLTVGGAPVTVSIGTPGQNEHLTFNGTAGQRVSLSRSGETFPTGTTDVFIENPDGSPLILPTAGAPGSMTLPQTGTYRVLVDPIGASTGSVTLTLEDCAGGGC